jgi:WhiB family transcriptional regulator, redox-sensing transcriptional regulator
MRSGQTRAGWLCSHQVWQDSGRQGEQIGAGRDDVHRTQDEVGARSCPADGKGAARGMVSAVNWRFRGACVDEDPELFFPVGNAGPALRQIDEAKQVCRRCDVVDVCLRWALQTGEDAGVWGGMSEEERRTLRLQASRTQAATAPGGQVSR